VPMPSRFRPILREPPHACACRKTSRSPVLCQRLVEEQDLATLHMRRLGPFEDLGTLPATPSKTWRCCTHGRNRIRLAHSQARTRAIH